MASAKDEANPEPEGPPQIVLEQALAAAGAQNEEEDAAKRPSTASTEHHNAQHHHGTSPHLDHVPKPAFESPEYGQLDINQNGMQTGAQVGKDGRVNINIKDHSHKLSNLLAPALRKQLAINEAENERDAHIPEDLRESEGLMPPPMNIVIQIVGSRGDVQPFVALGQVLKNKYNHRVRIATHPVFRDFVTENGLEFFSIGGDPAELMAFMVKNPGLMPGMDSIKSGDIGNRRKGIYEMITGCWRSCIEAGDGTGVKVFDDNADAQSFTSVLPAPDPSLRPFVADVIIANPPSFAHVHIAEKLGIPLHLMFTMPWSPTQAFPHPLANIISSNADPNMANFVSYALVDMMTWQGLGDVINKFRERSLGLEPISIMWAPGMASRLRIPWTYCWSPALIPKPKDWGNYIDISGFYFLNLATNYTPPADLAAFLEAGPPPVYIGFGSIVVDDPNAMTKMIFEAVKKTGQRALVSKGWGGLGADELGIPEGVFMLGNCPHDWLFPRVSCVVHHGGAGTTATGISAGKPTVVVPFFGDQPFWGAMCARAGAGPMPIAYKHLTADKLTSQIQEALKPESLERAKELSTQIHRENGTETGAEQFHKQLHVADLRCSLCPDRAASWRLKRTDIRLSPLAATVLGNEGLIDFTDLELYRAREYETEDGPWEPITGGAAALIGTIGNLTMGMADFPVEILHSLKGASKDVKEAHEKHRNSTSGQGTPLTSASTENVSKKTSPPNGSSPAISRASTSTGQIPIQPDALSREPTAVDSPTGSDSSRGRKSSAMASVMSKDNHSSSHSRHRHLSHSHTYGEGDKDPCPGEDAAHITTESVIGGARAAHKIVSAGIKSPMDFTLSLAKGFHNAPKLYGDTTVRKQEKITDFQSGVRVAAKEFGFGFFDGITGMVTQPIAGAKKEGAAGFFKGAAKGIGGVILKPGAAVWGLTGYTAKGIYAEIAKHFGSSVGNYIIAARTAQGYEEWKNSTPELREQIVADWRSSKFENRRQGKKYGQERKQEIEDHITTRTNTNSAELVHGFKNTKNLSWDERKALRERKDELKKREKELKREEATIKKNEAKEPHGFGKIGSRLAHRESHTPKHSASVSSQGQSEAVPEDFEAAIAHSVAQTSKGNPEEDAAIERALRASVRELHRTGSKESETEEQAYQRAIKASVEEHKKARSETAPQETGTVNVESGEHYGDSHDADLEAALHKSLEEYHMGLANRNAPPAYNADRKDDIKRAVEKSHQVRADTGSKSQLADIEAERQANADEDEQLKRAITESQLEHEKQSQALGKQKTQEQVMMDYEKKKALLEEEHQRNMAEFMKDNASST